jgi:hypothetical protein
MHAARVHSCIGRRAAYIGVHTDTALLFTALGFQQAPLLLNPNKFIGIITTALCFS